MKKVIAIIATVIFILGIGTSLFIYTRPVDWDAGACSGGYATYIFNKYGEELTQSFLNEMGKDKDNVISIEAIQDTHTVWWEDDKIFLQYDIKYIHKEDGVIIETVNFVGERVWIDTFKWSSRIVNIDTIKQIASNRTYY